jgi:PAS domain S-box-containing protein
MSPASADTAIVHPKSSFIESGAMLDALSDIVCVTGLDGTLKFLNRVGRDLLGFDDNDAALIGCLAPTHTPAARALLLDEIIPAALRRGTATSDTALQSADGRVFPASQTVLVTLGVNGQPVSLTMVIRNVSIERQVTARLGESQRLFEMIARCAPDLMFLYDPADERIVWMNRCPHAFLGGAERDARTLDRREMHRLVHPDDRAQYRAVGRRVSSAYSDTDVLTLEMRVRTAGARWRWVHTRFSVFSRRETGAPLLMLGTATDISAQKRAEQQLRERHDAVERGFHVSNDFLACISTEFRSALHGIIGTATDVHADRDRRLTARELELLQDMIAASTQLLATVADLHDFTRVEAGAMPVYQTLVDARHVIRESIAAFDDHPACARRALAMDMPAEATPVLTDPARLRQVLTHLIANALQGTPDARVTIALNVEQDTARPLSIHVHSSDPVDSCALVYHSVVPFTARHGGTGSGMQPARGTDLSLMLARAMCEMIGCSLSVAHEPGRAGATFRITLPAPSRSSMLAAGGRHDVVGTATGATAGTDVGNADQGSIVVPSV